MNIIRTLIKSSSLDYYLWKFIFPYLQPAPHRHKRNIVKKLAAENHIDILVETGTYHGRMIKAVKNSFSRIYSIELDESLAKEAKERFRQEKHIKIIQGDSGNELEKVLKNINNQPIMFWLDAHYSGGVTAKGEYGETPIWKELEVIFSSWNQDSIILIDDAREFTGINGYPSIGEIKEFVQNKNMGLALKTYDDFIQINS